MSFISFSVCVNYLLPLLDERFEHRKPFKNEWYINVDQPIQARFPVFGKREILKRVGVALTTLMHIGDPCEFCNVAHDDVEVGSCPGRIKNGILIDG